MRNATLVVVAVLLAGCWPARFVDRPGISGSVVSSASRAPIAGVRVALTMPTNEPFVVSTDEKGRFVIDARHQWGFYSFLGEGWPIQGMIEFAAAGYASQERRLSWPQIGPARQDLGAVELVPAQ
jgi:hypothetical protein